MVKVVFFYYWLTGIPYTRRDSIQARAITGQVKGNEVMLVETMGNIFRGHAEPETPVVDVRPGGTYIHRGAGNIVETAEVIDVGPDGSGIPHVRFKVLVERSKERHTHFEAVRTLNLQTFSETFSEPADA